MVSCYARTVGMAMKAVAAFTTKRTAVIILNFLGNSSFYFSFAYLEVPMVNLAK